MYTEWLQSDDFPGTRVKVKSLGAEEMFDLQVGGMRGRIVYDVLRATVLDWEHVPLIGKDRYSETFDPPAIGSIRTDVAIWIITEQVQRLSNLTESERKN